MKKFFLFTLLVAAVTFLPAQRISYQDVFAVNYSINGVGYPSKIIPNLEGGFAYMEFWPRGNGRKFPNHYLQSYSQKWEEQWFQPVTKEGAAKLGKMIDLIRFEGSIGILANQFSPSIKRDQVKMQFYGLDGQPQGGLQVVSSYTKKDKKDFEDVFDQSPDGNKLLWVGHNPSASASKRTVLASVWDGSGKKTWGKRLMIPHLADDKYQVKQATVDNRGHAYFLLTYEEITNTDKDTLHQPIVIRYDHRENKFTEQKLHFANSSLPESRIYITEAGELAFLGILSDSTKSGFLNGGKRYETALSWDKIVYQLYDIQRELLIRDDYAMPFPENWVQRYGERQANFSKSEIVEHKGKLYWVMEEFYNQIHNGQPQFLFKDVATVAIDKASGQIDWVNFFEKNQRDYNSGRLLSYSQGISNGKLNFVYLNERGAQGKIVCSSFDLKDGTATHKPLALNDKATNLFFPARSAMVSENKMILMGVGNPVDNDYKLIEVTFE